MARGLFTIEFESMEDLRMQLMQALGFAEVPAPKPATGTGCIYPTAPDMRDGATVIGPSHGVLGDLGADMSSPIDPSKVQAEEARTIPSEPAQVIRTASGIDAEMRQANKEQAAAALAALAPSAEAMAGAVAPLAATTTVPVAAQEQPAATAPQAEPAGDGVEVTLENLSTVDYPVLLALCERTPEIGVDAAKKTSIMFRKLVEHRIKIYLETK